MNAAERAEYLTDGLAKSIASILRLADQVDLDAGAVLARAVRHYTTEPAAAPVAMAALGGIVGAHLDVGEVGEPLVDPPPCAASDEPSF